MNNSSLCDRTFAVGSDTVNKFLPRIFGKPIGENGNYKKALLFFFCKALKTYEAIRTLQNRGFMEDARILTRSIFELRLQALYLDQEPKERTRQFLQHLQKAEFHGLKKYAASGKVKSLRFEGNAKPRVGRAGDWWGGGGLRKLAEQTDLEKEYDFEYWNLSEFGHSSATQMFRYVSNSEGKISLSYLPKKDEDFTTLYNATKWVFDIVACTANALEIEFEEEILSAARSLIGLSKRTPKQDP